MASLFESHESNVIPRRVQFSDTITIMEGSPYEPNPLSQFLEFGTAHELAAFMRYSMTKVDNKAPGNRTTLSDDSLNRWRMICMAFDSGEILEDFHVLLSEIFPSIVPGNVHKRWNMEAFRELYS